MIEMACITPINLRQEDGRDTLPVPCGKCGGCRKDRRADWTFRLKEELRASTNAFFITLTYDDQNLPEVINSDGEYVQTLDKKDFQDFMKRIREFQSHLTKTKIRYYCVGEYGTRFHRPHYHAIMFNLHKETVKNILEKWKKGHVHYGTVTDKSIHYVTKYHVNSDRKKRLQLGQEPEFTLCSKRPGIGYSYTLRAGDYHRDNSRTYVNNNGYKQRLPRYLRNKIFSEEQQYTLSHEARVNARVLKNETENRLKELGINDPAEYIWFSEWLKAQDVKHKRHNEKDIF